MQMFARPAITGWADVKFEFDGEKFLIVGDDGKTIKIWQDGLVERKVFWTGVFVVKGLWEEALKFLDVLIGNKDFKDAEVERDVVPKVWIYYDVVKVYLAEGFSEIEVGSARFQIYREGVYLTVDDGKSGLYEDLGFNVLAEFISRYYDKVLKLDWDVKFRKAKNWVAVDGLRFNTDWCRCLPGRRKIIALARRVKLWDLLDWLIEVVKTKKPDDMEFNGEEFIVYYGNLKVLFTKNFKFAGFEYKCECLVMKLRVIGNSDVFELMAKKPNFYVKANVLRFFSGAQNYYKTLNDLAQESKYLKALGF